MLTYPICIPTGDAVYLRVATSPKTLLRDVIAGVCEEHDVTEAQIRSRDRHKRIAAARHELFRRCRALGWSYPDIGREFDRDHTTVMTACKVGQR